MNQQQFTNMFNQFAKGSKGPSMGGMVLFGLGYLALNSYYYGTSSLTQLMSVTMPSNLTSFQTLSPHKSTEKASTSNYPSSNNLSSIMSRPEKMKSLLKLLTETCKASSYQSEFFSIRKSINLMLSTKTLAKTMNRKFCLLSATKS